MAARPCPSRGTLLLVGCALARAPRARIAPFYFSVGGRPCQPATEPRWSILHIPKCGSVIEQLGLEYGAVDHALERHHPLQRAPEAWPMTMTMLRQPEERVVSMYMYFLHHPPPRNYNNRNGFGFGSRPQMKHVYEAVHAHRPVAEVFERFRGCQSNMLNHRYCLYKSRYYEERTTPALRARWRRDAIRKLNALGFVGILEELRLSVCLLNKVFTGEAFYMQRQLRTMNPTITPAAAAKAAAAGGARARPGALFETSTSRLAAARSGINVTLEPDVMDGALYGAGRALLRRRLAAANVSEATCARVPDDYVRTCACTRPASLSSSKAANKREVPQAPVLPACSEAQVATASDARAIRAAVDGIAGAGCCAVLPRPRRSAVV